MENQDNVIELFPDRASYEKRIELLAEATELLRKMPDKWLEVEVQELRIRLTSLTVAKPQLA